MGRRGVGARFGRGGGRVIEMSGVGSGEGSAMAVSKALRVYHVVGILLISYLDWRYLGLS